MAKARKNSEFGLEELRELARLHAPEALERIVQVMRDKRYPKSALVAAQMVLDRAYGKVPSIQAGEGGEGAIAHTLEVRWKLPERSQPILLEAKQVADVEND